MVEDLMKSGDVYADDTDPEEMKKEREQRTESKNRNNCKLTFCIILFGVPGIYYYACFAFHYITHMQQ